MTKALFANTAVDANNPLWDTDSYKYSHAQMYPEGTQYASATIEARAPLGAIDEVLFFGLQMELAKLAEIRITNKMIDEADEFLKGHGFTLYTEGWRKIANELGGKLPVRISALPEGSIVKPGIPQVRIENTDPDLYWLPSFLETRLLRAVWYPSTVASRSYAAKKILTEKMMKTDGNIEGLEFKLHDFGARGATSHETAGIGGAAHLVSFWGTDTVAGLIAARNFYGAEMAGFSINATEHSVMTARGRDGERDVMKRILDQNPTGLISMVCDSYDLMHAIRQYIGKDFRAQILARDGTLVIRPDSGDPLEIVPDAIEALMGAFGSTLTSEGYRILPQQVRVIQGDGVTLESLPLIADVLIERGLAIGNLAFGMGGGLLQQVNRDNFGYAMKTNALCINGQWVDVFKDPITAKGTKTSKKGRQGAYLTGMGLVARRVENIPAGADALVPVFENGEILKIWTFDEVRAQANAGELTGYTLQNAA
jgi:nicotinamide phosphoribosyltransferase